MMAMGFSTLFSRPPAQAQAQAAAAAGDDDPLVLETLHSNLSLHRCSACGAHTRERFCPGSCVFSLHQFASVGSGGNLDGGRIEAKTISCSGQRSMELRCRESVAKGANWGPTVRIVMVACMHLTDDMKVGFAPRRTKRQNVNVGDIPLDSMLWSL
jgi:hypothetical protein